MVQDEEKKVKEAQRKVEEARRKVVDSKKKVTELETRLEKVKQKKGLKTTVSLFREKPIPFLKYPSLSREKVISNLGEVYAFVYGN